MASISRADNGRFSIYFKLPTDGKRHQVRLGKVKKSVATAVKIHVENILMAMQFGTLAFDTRLWLERISPEMKDRLQRARLVTENIAIEPPERTSTKRGCSLVYFCQYQAGGPIKIGTTSDMKKTVMRLGQMGRPTVLLTIYGDRRLEKSIHQRFDSDRIERELFRPSHDVLDFILDLFAKNTAIAA